jgi:lysophospholipase L1-like esterase
VAISRTFHLRAGFFASTIVALLLAGGSGSAAQTRPEAGNESWNGTWASSQQPVQLFGRPGAEEFSNATLRQFVHLSMGGTRLRIHLSNVFGISPLRIHTLHIARAVSPAACKIDPATDKQVTFSGEAGVEIPPGAEFVSDPIDFNADPLSDLAITLYLDGPPARQTGHPGSRTTSCSVPGNAVTDAQLSRATTFEQWFYISAVDVESPRSAASIVVLGDSITDGHAATTNGNDRWTDVLAERLQADASLKDRSVLNQGIGGNHLLIDGIGPNAVSRLDRDVLAQTGVKYLMVLEGINDLGGLARTGPVSPAEHEELVRRMTQALQQIVTQAHTHGIRVYGGTIMPDDGSAYYHPDAASDRDRNAVNDWIRAPGHFDAVIDFDRVMRDPAQPGRLAPQYDSGDHLHPGPAGYKAMGDAVPLALFAH